MMKSQEDRILANPSPGQRLRRWLRLPFLWIAGSTLSHQPATERPVLLPERILVIRPDHLGDVLFSTPALALLREAFPKAHIAYLCGPWSSPLLERNPHLDRVLTCDFPWFNRRPKGAPWQPYLLLWQQAQRLRREGFDMAINLRFDFWWGAWLAALAYIPWRIGYNLPECRPFLTHAIPYSGGRHEVSQNLALIAAAEGEIKAAIQAPDLSSWSWQRYKLEFYPAPEDEAYVRHLLGEQETPFPGKPLVCIHAGSGARVKHWPPERWAIVADDLAQRFQARIVLTGSAAEEGLTREIARRMHQPATILAGRTSLSQLAALFARSSLVLGPDSGPLHLAVAMGTPTIHLYGPVDPATFGPWGDPQRHLVLQAHYYDDPCHGRPCNRLDYSAAELAIHTCMATITPEEVLAAAEGLFGLSLSCTVP